MTTLGVFFFVDFGVFGRFGKMAENGKLKKKVLEFFCNLWLHVCCVVRKYVLFGSLTRVGVSVAVAACLRER